MFFTLLFLAATLSYSSFGIQNNHSKLKKLKFYSCGEFGSIDNRLNSFIENYFEENNILKNDNYVLFMYQRKDTTIFTLYPLRYDINIYSIRPVGVIQWKDHKIFVTISGFVLLTKNPSKKIYNMCKNSIKNIPTNRNLPYKIWMLKVPTYGDTSFIEKRREIIEQELKPRILEDL